MEMIQSKSGLLIPKPAPEPEKPVEPKAYAPVETLAKVPFGDNADGSFTLCPKVMKIVRHHMLRRGSIISKLDEENEPFIEKLADAIWLHQGISFEQYT